MTWKPDTLAALVGAVDHNRVCRIVRVVEDRGKMVLVKTDETIENAADFPTPEPAIFEVPAYRLRPIVADCPAEWLQ